MRLRDRRAPLTAIVLGAAYLLLIISPVLFVAQGLDLYRPQPFEPALRWLLIGNFVALVWRTLFRAVFTAREYSLYEGVMAVMRVPLANIIAIMAGRGAISAYLASLYSGRVKWDHTIHLSHPALASAP
jgi:adsorption protein B